VVAQVLIFKFFDLLIPFNRKPAPLLMDDIGQDRLLLFAFNLMIFPVIGQLIAGFLPCHPLLNPFFAPAMLFPIIPCAVERPRRIVHILNPLVTHLRQSLIGSAFEPGTD